MEDVVRLGILLVMVFQAVCGLAGVILVARGTREMRLLRGSVESAITWAQRADKSSLKAEQAAARTEEATKQTLASSTFIGGMVGEIRDAARTLAGKRPAAVPHRASSPSFHE